MDRAKKLKKNAEVNLKDAEENLGLILKSQESLAKKWEERKMVDDQEGLKKCQTKKKRPKTQEEDETASKRFKNKKEESDSEDEEESESQSVV
jgi:hypothetical protein